MKDATPIVKVLDQQLALSAYLEALLQPPPETGVDPAAGSAAAPETPGPVAALQAAAASPDGVPDWARERFQALLFEVVGLTLAVPLVMLKGVVANDGGVTPMPGHSPLFLGVVGYQGVQCKVVDTATFVLPADRAVQLSADSADRSAHLVVIDEGRWALACSRIGKVIDLASDDVKWRTVAGKRVWLAGTVIDRMCALLDIDALTAQLVEGMA
jgi:purine-binding chemotaxis protein CheW